jgi:hypothetical protein
MTSRPIVAPAEIFRRFTDSYRDLKPRRRISAELASIINAVIDDICAGREITAFLEGNPFLDVELASGSDLKCSKSLLFFFEFLCRAMHEQDTFHLTPTRATEILYNLVWDDRGPHQQVLTLEAEPHRSLCYLVSTEEYEKQAAVRLRLTLGTANDASDWTVLPQGWDNLGPSPYEGNDNNDDDDDGCDDDTDPDDHGRDLPSALYG